MEGQIWIGTAGWSIPKDLRDASQGESGLERYASLYNCVEINSCFYRPHKPETYARWGESVPANFRFSLKLPKVITHEKKLVAVGDEIDFFMAAAGQLKEKWGCLLVQLPPKLEFDLGVTQSFFQRLRQSYHGVIAFEPRHLSWVSSLAQEALFPYEVSFVAADPERMKFNFSQDPIRYYRWHGSPVIYQSAYTDEALNGLAAEIKNEKIRDVWCIFDNTMFGHASHDALKLAQRLGSKPAVLDWPLRSGDSKGSVSL